VLKIIRLVQDTIAFRLITDETYYGTSILQIPFTTPEVGYSNEVLRGEIVMVGPGRRSQKTGKLVPMDVNVGDIVRFHNHERCQLEPGSDIYITRESYIQGVEE